MGRETSMVALDSNAMTYWIDALSSLSCPPAEPCSLEKLALVRIFFWMPKESGFHYTPTVETEFQAIRDRLKRDNHVSWALTHISGVRPLPDPDAVDARARELVQFHKREKDCRILAECELTEIISLLTCDTDLLKKLRAKTRIRLCLPSEYWERMAVSKGTVPTWAPHPTNPLSKLSWWRW